MSKGKAKTLLSIIGILLAAIIVLAFVPFSVGAVKEYNSAVGAIDLDYDLEGGVAYTLTLAEDNEEEVDDVNDVIKTIKFRLDELGYSVYSVKAIKSADQAIVDYDIRIETELKESTPQDIQVVAAYGDVIFYGGASANPTEEVLTGVEAIKSAKYLGAVTDYRNNTYYQTAIEFTEEGYEALHQLIHSAESYYLQINLGEQVLLSGDSAISENYFQNKTLVVNGSSEASAKQMALQISSGGLAQKYELSDGQTISSPYGQDVALKALLAIAAFVFVVMVAFIIIYKGMGIASALSMLAFILIETWMMIAVPGITLSMGGVIGIVGATVLSAIGMIMTCTRVKEEFSHSEKTVKAALNKGFKQSLIPVINVNVIAGFVAVLLLIFAKGAVKNFATTFGIGVIVSMIATLVFTRMFIALLLPLARNKEKFLNVKKEEA